MNGTSETLTATSVDIAWEGAAKLDQGRTPMFSSSSVAVTQIGGGHTHTGLSQTTYAYHLQADIAHTMSACMPARAAADLFPFFII